MNVGILACPITKLGLVVVPLAEARRAIGAEKLSCRDKQPGFNAEPFGETESVLLRSDHKAAYPLVDGIAVLLAPEILTHPDHRPVFDLHAPQYEEAYEEMDHYNNVGRKLASALSEAGSLDAERGFSIQGLNRIGKTPAAERGVFPNPHGLWLGTRVDVAAELDCFEHIAPVADKRMLQVGGSGDISLRFILAGASEGVLLTPMIGEAYVAIEIAKILGVDDKLQCVIGVGEELPFAGNSFDGCVAGACVHHMETSLAFPEMHRVLHPGGKFAAFEPWRAPLHNLGTRIFGKRETSVHCRPMDPNRLQPLRKAFADSSSVLHGTLTRYPLVVLSDKLRIPLTLLWAERLAKWDDWVCDMIPGARRFGSGLAMLATKSH